MLEIFTDGACSQNGTQAGGWAFVVRHEGLEIHHDKNGEKNTTNNRMELLAFKNALDYAAKNHPNKKLIIHTDSAYVSNTFFNKWYVRWIENNYKNAKKETIAHVELWKGIFIYLNKIEEGNIVIKKVKGHDGIDGNVRADFLATKAKDEVIL